MIRLAFLVDSPSRRAHANVVARLALGLVETGQAETTIVCYSTDPPPSWLPPEVRIHRLGVERVSRSVPSLVRYLRAEQPDVLITRQVHANFVGLAAARMARMPPRWRGKIVLAQDQFVELCHALNWRDNKWVAKASYRFADGLIAPSPAVRDNAVQSCRLDPSSAALVPNPIPKFTGTPASPPHPWLRSGEPPVFVNIGNLLSVKRVDLLIDAFAELRRSHDARLLIVGQGPDRSGADEQIRRLGLSAKAETTGWVEDVLPYAAHAWALGTFLGRGRVRAGADRGDECRLPGGHCRLAGWRAPLRNGGWQIRSSGAPERSGEARRGHGRICCSRRCGRTMPSWAISASRRSPRWPAPAHWSIFSPGALA